MVVWFAICFPSPPCVAWQEVGLTLVEQGPPVLNPMLRGPSQTPPVCQIILSCSVVRSHTLAHKILLCSPNEHLCLMCLMLWVLCCPLCCFPSYHHHHYHPRAKAIVILLSVLLSARIFQFLCQHKLGLCFMSCFQFGPETILTVTVTLACSFRSDRKIMKSLLLGIQERWESKCLTFVISLTYSLGRKMILLRLRCIICLWQMSCVTHVLLANRCLQAAVKRRWLPSQHPLTLRRTWLHGCLTSSLFFNMGLAVFSHILGWSTAAYHKWKWYVVSVFS